MLTLSPLKNKEEIKKIFESKNIKYSEISGVLTAKCGEKLLGLSLYNLERDKIIILLIEPLEDIPLADGILRSTLHVATEKSIMDAFYSETVPEKFLEAIDFIKCKEDKTLLIDKLFKSCCNCR